MLTRLVRRVFELNNKFEKLKHSIRRDEEDKQVIVSASQYRNWDDYIADLENVVKDSIPILRKIAELDVEFEKKIQTEKLFIIKQRGGFGEYRKHKSELKSTNKLVKINALWQDASPLMDSISWLTEKYKGQTLPKTIFALKGNVLYVDGDKIKLGRMQNHFLELLKKNGFFEGKVVDFYKILPKLPNFGSTSEKKIKIQCKRYYEEINKKSESQFGTKLIIPVDWVFSLNQNL